MSSPEFDRPQAVLLEQSVPENVVDLARFLWPEAVVVRFDDGDADDRVLARVESALTSGRA